MEGSVIVVKGQVSWEKVSQVKFRSKSLFTVTVSILLFQPVLGEDNPNEIRDAEATTSEGDTLVRIEQSIQKLSSSKFSERNQATEELISLGLAAAQQVRAASDSNDFEVRLRCETVLRTIRHLERFQLIEGFLNDNLDANIQLPGWDEFKATVGDNATTRGLFAQMLENEWRFLDEVFDAPESETSQLLTNRCNKLMLAKRQNQEIDTLGTLATLLFIGSSDRFVVSGPPYPVALFQFFYSSEFNWAVRRSTSRQPMMQLLGRFVSRESGLPENWLLSRILLSLHYRVPEGLDLAKKTATETKAPVNTRQYSLLAIGKLGTEEDLTILVSMLEDSENCSPVRNAQKDRFTTQIRDIALATLVRRAGESMADYGLERIQLDENTFFRPSTVGFASEEKREAAIQLWRTRHPNLANLASDDLP